MLFLVLSLKHLKFWKFLKKALMVKLNSSSITSFHRLCRYCWKYFLYFFCIFFIFCCWLWTSKCLLWNFWNPTIIEKFIGQKILEDTVDFWLCNNLLDGHNKQCTVMFERKNFWLILHQSNSDWLFLYIKLHELNQNVHTSFLFNQSARRICFLSNSGHRY